MGRKLTTREQIALAALAVAVFALLPARSSEARLATAADVIASNQVLTSDIHCTDLIISLGVTVTSDGFNIYCSGSFANHGTIITGLSRTRRDLLRSYGGSGGGGAPTGLGDGYPGRSTRAPGGRAGINLGPGGTPGFTPSRPQLSGALVSAWIRAGMSQYLTGAAGGDGRARECAGYTGSAGAYGIAIVARNVDAGRIVATGNDGEYSACSGSSGGGGGGVILIEAESGGYIRGSYDVSGGTGSANSGPGGAGRVFVVRKGSEAASPTRVSVAIPSIEALSASPSSLGPTGGFVTFAWRTRNTSKCYLTYVYSNPSSVPSSGVRCSSGKAVVDVPAAKSWLSTMYVFTLTASNGDGTVTTARTIDVFLAGAPSVTKVMTKRTPSCPQGGPFTSHTIRCNPLPTKSTNYSYVGACVGASAQLITAAGLSVGGETCVDFGAFGWAVIVSGSGTAGAGGKVGVSGSIGVTWGGAQTTADLSGCSISYSTSGQLGVGIGATGSSDCLHPTKVSGEFDVLIGLDGGASVNVGLSGSCVLLSSSGYQNCLPAQGSAFTSATISQGAIKLSWSPSTKGGGR